MTLDNYYSVEEFNKREIIGTKFEYQVKAWFDSRNFAAIKNPPYSHCDLNIPSLDTGVEAKERRIKSDRFRELYLPKIKMDALAGTRTLVYQHFTVDDKYLLLNCQHLDLTDYKVVEKADYGAKTLSYQIPLTEFSYVEPEEFIDGVISQAYFEDYNPSLSECAFCECDAMSNCDWVEAERREAESLEHMYYE